MVYNLFRSRAFLSILLLSLAVFYGCKENTLISSKLSPANDQSVVKADTLYTCVTHTFFEDDNFTSTNLNGIPIYQGVGSLTDPYFGTMTAATYFQIANPVPGFTFSASYVIDSVVLVLPYSGFTYGDTTNQTLTEKLQVFYLGDTMGYNTPYFCYSDKAIDMTYPLSAPVDVNIYNLQDSINVSDTNRCPGLHIKLNEQITMARLNAAMFASTPDLTSDPADAFIAAFKGICVRPADYRVFSGAIPYFRLDALGLDVYSQAGLVVYYHNDSLNGNDSEMTYEFTYNQAGCANFNAITKSYSKFPVNNMIHSTQANDSVVALQNMPGECIDIKIGGLISQLGPNFLQNNVISQAKLMISLTDNPMVNFTTFAPPDQLYPQGIGNGTYPPGIISGLTYEVQDRLPETSLTPYYILDGTSHIFNYVTTAITSYTIGLPREVIASIAANNDTLHLHLHGTQVLYGAYRMFAAGGNYPDNRYRAKLIVVHSSLKN